jgi:serine phosphatase RsbU (regulator of sigma subunit)
VVLVATGQPMRRFHPVSIAILVAGLLVVAGATIVTEVLHRDTEQRLLDQRTGEAGAVLVTAISGLQTPLASAAELAEATNGDEAGFRAVMGRLVGDGKQFIGASLYAVDSTDPLVAVGGATVLSTAEPTRVRAMLDAAVAAPQLSVVDLLDLPGRHIGYAFTSFEDPARYVVYAEAALPQRSRTTGPFQDLDYATYLGADPSTSELLFTSVAEMPIRGRTSHTVVPFGDRQLTLVTASSASLGGELSRLLPWLIALIGLVLVSVGAILAQRLLRRRAEAEALAADVSRLYDDQRHRAETLQRSLLPRELPQPPGVEVAARYWPADTSSEIGGDFYDLFELDDGRWGITIGDVCGKGIEAAALTGVTRHTIRAAARHLESPADVLGWTYEAISAYSGETYATVCFAFLSIDDARAELDIALGGHPGPLLWRADGSVEVLGTSGTVLGLVEPHVTRQRYELRRGDTVVFYTDGITDAPSGQALSLDELQEAVRGSAASSPDAMADAIRASVERRRPGGSGDDTAMLIIQFGDRPVPDDPSVTDESTGDASLRPVG